MLVDIKAPRCCRECVFYDEENACKYSNVSSDGMLNCPFVADEECTYNRVVAECGTDHQLVVAIEEFSECQKELTKTLRGIGNMEHLAEEIADCLISIEQVMQIYSLHNVVRSEHFRKFKRLRECLENGTFLNNKKML